MYMSLIIRTAGTYGKDEVCVFLTPSSQKDYQVARMLAENGVSTVLVNGSFKVK